MARAEAELRGSVELDEMFAKLKPEIDKLVTQLDRVTRVRMKVWMTKLREPTNNTVWKRNRNMHARLLLGQLRSQQPLAPPFSTMPPEGPLPTLQPYLTYRFMATSPRSRSSSPQGGEPQVQKQAARRVSGMPRQSARPRQTERPAVGTAAAQSQDISVTTGAAAWGGNVGRAGDRHAARAISGRQQQQQLPGAGSSSSVIPEVVTHELQQGLAAQEGLTSLLEWRLKQAERTLSNQEGELQHLKVAGQQHEQQQLQESQARRAAQATLNSAISRLEAGAAQLAEASGSQQPLLSELHRDSENDCSGGSDGAVSTRIMAQADGQPQHAPSTDSPDLQAEPSFQLNGPAAMDAGISGSASGGRSTSRGYASETVRSSAMDATSSAVPARTSRGAGSLWQPASKQAHGRSGRSMGGDSAAELDRILAQAESPLTPGAAVSRATGLVGHAGQEPLLHGTTRPSSEGEHTTTSYFAAAANISPQRRSERKAAAEHSPGSHAAARLQALAEATEKLRLQHEAHRQQVVAGGGTPGSLISESELVNGPPATAAKWGAATSQMQLPLALRRLASPPVRPEEIRCLPLDVRSLKSPLQPHAASVSSPPLNRGHSDVAWSHDSVAAFRQHRYASPRQGNGRRSSGSDKGACSWVHRVRDVGLADDAESSQEHAARVDNILSSVERLPRARVQGGDRNGAASDRRFRSVSPLQAASGRSTARAAANGVPMIQACEQSAASLQGSVGRSSSLGQHGRRLRHDLTHSSSPVGSPTSFASFSFAQPTPLVGLTPVSRHSAVTAARQQAPLLQRFPSPDLMRAQQQIATTQQAASPDQLPTAYRSRQARWKAAPAAAKTGHNPRIASLQLQEIERELAGFELHLTALSRRMECLWRLPAMVGSAADASPHASRDMAAPNPHQRSINMLRRAFLQLRSSMALTRSRLGIGTAASLAQRARRRVRTPSPLPAWRPGGCVTPQHQRPRSVPPMSAGTLVMRRGTPVSSKDVLQSVFDDFEAEVSELAAALRRLVMAAPSWHLQQQLEQSEAALLQEQRALVEAEVALEAEQLKEAASQLCQHLQALAQEPAFAPHGTRSSSRHNTQSSVATASSPRHRSLWVQAPPSTVHVGSPAASPRLQSGLSPIQPLDLTSTLRRAGAHQARYASSPRMLSPTSPGKSSNVGAARSVSAGNRSRGSLFDTGLLSELETQALSDAASADALASLLTPGAASMVTSERPEAGFPGHALASGIPFVLGPAAALPEKDVTGRAAPRLLPPQLREQLLSSEGAGGQTPVSRQGGETSSAAGPPYHGTHSSRRHEPTAPASFSAPAVSPLHRSLRAAANEEARSIEGFRRQHAALLHDVPQPRYHTSPVMSQMDVPLLQHQQQQAQVSALPKDTGHSLHSVHQFWAARGAAAASRASTNLMQLSPLQWATPQQTAVPEATVRQPAAELQHRPAAAYSLPTHTAAQIPPLTIQAPSSGMADILQHARQHDSAYRAVRLHLRDSELFNQEVLQGFQQLKAKLGLEPGLGAIPSSTSAATAAAGLPQGPTAHVSGLGSERHSHGLGYAKGMGGVPAIDERAYWALRESLLPSDNSEPGSAAQTSLLHAPAASQPPPALETKQGMGAAAPAPPSSQPYNAASGGDAPRHNIAAYKPVSASAPPAPSAPMPSHQAVSPPQHTAPLEPAQPGNIAPVAALPAASPAGPAAAVQPQQDSLGLQARLRALHDRTVQLQQRMGALVSSGPHVHSS